MRMIFTVAVRNLLQAKRRSLLLFASLAFVSMFLVVLMALSQGITDTMEESATVLFSGHVNVAGWYKAKPSDAMPLTLKTGELRKVIEENTPGLDYVIDRGRGWAKLVSTKSSLYAGLNSIDVAEEGNFVDKVQLAREDEYKEGGREEVLGDMLSLRDADTALIFAGQAKKLGLGVGDIMTLSAETMGGATNTIDVRVVAIARDMGFMSNYTAFLPKQTLQKMYDISADTSGAVMVYLKDPRQSATIMEHLRVVLADKGYTVMEHQPQPFWMKFEVVGGEDWVGQKVDLTTWEDEVGMMKWVIGAIDSISFFLVLIMLIIIIVGIVNTMFIAVRERTNEIGTLRAIGMRKGVVLRLFLVEAAILGAVATTAGSLLGVALSMGLNAAEIELGVEAVRAVLMSDNLRLTPRLGQIVGSVVTFTFVTSLAALWPAVRAARLKPITAINRV